MMLTPSGVSTCPRRGRGKAASPLVSRMPRLNKHTNGSHPDQQDLLHGIVPQSLCRVILNLAVPGECFAPHSALRSIGDKSYSGTWKKLSRKDPTIVLRTQQLLLPRTHM